MKMICVNFYRNESVNKDIDKYIFKMKDAAAFYYSVRNKRDY